MIISQKKSKTSKQRDQNKESKKTWKRDTLKRRRF